MASDSPGKYVSRLPKVERRGHILVDWLRNGLGSTAVASFSPRARPGATVATPVSWREVDETLDPASFTLSTVPERLEKAANGPLGWIRRTGAICSGHSGAGGGAEKEAMMAERPIWRGHLRLALVSCPVALYSARHERGNLRFHFINPQTGHRVRMITLDAETGEELSRGELVKGYEFKKDHYLIMTDEDFESARVESSSTMTVDKFVPGESINPIYYDSELLSRAGRRCRPGCLRRAAGGDRQDRARRALSCRHRPPRARHRADADAERDGRAHLARGARSE